MKKVIAALDIGGTSIKSGMWDGKQVLQKENRFFRKENRIPMPNWAAAM